MTTTTVDNNNILTKSLRWTASNIRDCLDKSPKGSLGNPCRGQLRALSSSALSNQRWALQVLDSSARVDDLTSSYLGGATSLVSQTNYDKCVGLRNHIAQDKFDPKFCRADFQLIMLNGQTGSDGETSKASHSLMPARLGLCAPSECKNDELASLFKSLFDSYSNASLSTPSISSMSTYANHQVSCHEPSPQLGALASLLVWLVYALVGMVLYSSLSQMWPEVLGSGWLRRLHVNPQMLSLQSNFNRLNVRRKPVSSSVSKLLDLSHLDGIRALCGACLVIMHSVNFASNWLSFDNPHDVEARYKPLIWQPLASAFLMVDNYSLISGFLASLYLVTADKEIKQSQGAALKSSLANCLHRYLRLAPTMVVVILLSLAWLPKLAYGPNWPEATAMFDAWCRPSWPLNLAMVQNLNLTSSSSAGKICFGHSWFVAADFQLFVVLQLSHSLWPNHLSAISLVAMLLSQAFVTSKVYSSKFSPIPLVAYGDGQETPGWSLARYSLGLYTKPVNWAFSYFLGVFMAQYLIKYTKDCHYNSTTEAQPETSATKDAAAAAATFVGAASPKRLAHGWALWLVPVLGPVMRHCVLNYLAYPYFNGRPMDQLEASLYAALVRPLYSMSLALVIFVLAPKVGNRFKDAPVARWLASSFNNAYLIPFSELNYLVYLLNPLVIALVYGRQTQTYHYSVPLMVYFAIINLICSYSLAFVASLFVELPVRNLVNKFELAVGLRKPQQQ